MRVYKRQSEHCPGKTTVDCVAYRAPYWGQGVTKRLRQVVVGGGIDRQVTKGFSATHRSVRKSNLTGVDPATDLTAVESPSASCCNRFKRQLFNRNGYRNVGYL